MSRSVKLDKLRRAFADGEPHNLREAMLNAGYSDLPSRSHRRGIVEWLVRVAPGVYRLRKGRSK